MPQNALLHEDRLFPSDAAQRAIARRLSETVRNLPVISPHGHTNPSPHFSQGFVARRHCLFLELLSN
jgi:glucuronate isomerase